jgi:hypothetical protein
MAPLSSRAACTVCLGIIATLGCGSEATPTPGDAGVSTVDARHVLDSNFVDGSALPDSNFVDGSASRADASFSAVDASHVLDSDFVDGPVASCALVDAPYSYPISCYWGDIGGACDDTGPLPTCVDGRWACVTSYGRPLPTLDQCKCFGLPRAQPEFCACTDQGWRCAIDGGTVDS